MSDPTNERPRLDARALRIAPGRFTLQLRLLGTEYQAAQLTREDLRDLDNSIVAALRDDGYFDRTEDGAPRD